MRRILPLLEMDTGAGSVHRIAEDTAEHWVIHTTPGKSSDWSRIVTRIAKADNLPREVEFYDRKDRLARVMTVDRVETHDGVEVPMSSVMKDLRRGTSTRMEILEVKCNVSAEELSDEMSTAAYMERNGQPPCPRGPCLTGLFPSSCCSGRCSRRRPRGQNPSIPACAPAAASGPRGRSIPTSTRAIWPPRTGWRT